MRKNFIKGLALGMAICMGIVGCGTNSSSSDAGTTAGNKETEGTTAGTQGGDETTTQGEVELYPAYDFGGETFIILAQNDINGRNPEATDDEYQKEERQAKLDEIQKKYNCKIEFMELQTTNWDEIPQEIVNNWTAGLPVPDVIDLYYNYLAPMITNDILYDMTDLLKDDTRYKDTNKVVLLGSRYGISSPIAGEGLYYNKDMIKDAGMEYTPAEKFAMGEWSYDHMYEYLVELKANMQDEEQEGEEYPLFVAPYYWALFGSSANGVKLIDDEGELCYVSDAFIETMDFINKCVSEGLSWIPLTDTGSYNNWGGPGETFDQGKKVAIAHRAAWQASGCASKFDLGFVPYPWGTNVTIDESKVGEMDAYLTLDGYMQTYYDGQVMAFTKNIEEKADPMELTSMLCELMGWDWMLTDYVAPEGTTSTVGWLEEGSLDTELYNWSRTVEIWQYYNSIAGMWQANLPEGALMSWTKMVYENQGIRTTLQSAYTAEQTAADEALAKFFE